MKILVLLSGGLDSCVLAARAKREGHVDAISFRYGSRHEDVEMQAARQVAEALSIERKTVDLAPQLFSGAGSALMRGDGEPMPHLTYEQIAESEGPSPTYVPYRNGVMISIATAVALTQRCTEVWAAMHAEDAHNWAYPDCTPEFTGAQAEAVRAGTYGDVTFHAPFQHMTKAEIVKEGLRLRAPLGATWSCYEPIVTYEGRAVRPCGECPTCVARAHAFAEAGADDPALAVAP